jgi:hypothetical protein
MVSFLKYLAWQTMHFLQHSTHFSNVLQTIDRFEISCLRAHFSWLEKPWNHIQRDLDCCIPELRIWVHDPNVAKWQCKDKLCRSNVTFISDQSTTAWQVVRWHRVETLISELNPPGCSLSQFWCDSGGPSGTLGLLYTFPSVPCAFLCAFLRAGFLENKLQVPPYAIWCGVWWHIVIADMTRCHHTWFL